MLSRRIASFAYQKAADISADLQRLQQETGEDALGAASTRGGWRLKRMARKRWRAAAGALLAGVIVAAGIHFYPRTVSALSAKDTIVLADVINKSVVTR